MNTC